MVGCWRVSVKRAVAFPNFLFFFCRSAVFQHLPYASNPSLGNSRIRTLDTATEPVPHRSAGARGEGEGDAGPLQRRRDHGEHTALGAEPVLCQAHGRQPSQRDAQP